MSKIFTYELFSLRVSLLIPWTLTIPLDPNFMLVVSTRSHIFELSTITGTVSDKRSTSYKESIAQELAAHLAH